MRAKKCVLIDGSSYLFRAYHALPPLLTSQGEPTGAMFGCLKMIQKIQKEEQPDTLVVVFDSKEKTMRHAWYPEYKANRSEMPEELAVQIAPLQTMIQALGLPLVIKPGIEADDVIGSFARQAVEAGYEVLISTGDKDFAQLVCPEITLVNTMTGERMDPSGVVKKFGVEPDRIVDYLALIGDTVDNVPGVHKVGPKTAVKWLTQYGSLEVIMKEAEHFTGKIGEYLRGALPWLPQAKRLVTIYTDIPMEETVAQFYFQEQDTALLKKLWTRYEFKQLLQALPGKEEVTTKETTLKTLAVCLQSPTLAICVAWDQEQVVGFSVCTPALEAYHSTEASFAKEWSLLQKWFSHPEHVWVGYHLKAVLHLLARVACYPHTLVRDILLASYVLESTADHRYAAIATALLPLEPEAVDVQNAVQVMQLYQAQKALLEKNAALWSLFTTLECPCIQVLWLLEHRGVLVDTALLEQQSMHLGKKIEELTEKAYLEAGEAFNLNSPKQLQAILFEKLGLPMIEKTPTGQPSTGESVLQELSEKYELPRIILQHRTLSKLKSTYTDKLPLQVNAITHRVHTTFQQAVTATGRLSSQDPNLQNIPIRTEEGSAIRRAFIAPENHLILCADYSQIELRIMAHLSNDEGLIKAFHLGEDIHRFTASEIFEVPLQSVTSEQRRYAKTINFGLIYGMSAFGVAKALGVSRQEAEQFIQSYFLRYPGVATFMETTRERARKQGYIETLLGRRLYLPEIASPVFQKRQAAERAAINAPMQGTAADIIKCAMLEVEAWSEPYQDRIRMILQVHDELVFEVDPLFVEEAKQHISRCMTAVVQLAVPLVVDIGVGPHWQAAH